MENETLSKYMVSATARNTFKEYYDAITDNLPEATEEEVNRYHTSPKTKSEQEENHLITSTLQARALPLIGNGESLADKIKKPHEKKTLYILMLITAFYGDEFKNVNEAKIAFRKHFCEVLENTEDNLRVVLDEIKYLWEYEHVLYSLYEFGFGESSIANLDYKSKQQIYIEKQSYLREKRSVLTFLKKYNLSTIEVEKHTLDPNLDKKYLYRHQRQTLKLAKEILNSELRIHCKTGKRRAKDISRILDYI